jgi:CSLREA domain-containing protein
MKILRLIFISFLGLTFVAGMLAVIESTYAASNSTLTVDSVVDAVDVNPGDGICATAANECTLRAAIQEANAFPGIDTIFIPSGSYTRTIGGIGGDASVGDLNIIDSVTIAGEARNSTIIDANLLDRVFAVSDMAVLTLTKVTLTRGLTPGIGGGIYIESGAKATIDDVAILNNEGGGGGIHARGQLTVTNSLIAENSAPSGNSGGGILGYDADIKIVNTTIRDNTASSRGGGVFIQEPGFTELIDVTISGNESASNGGGLTNLGGAGIDNHGVITLTNSTVVNNQSENSIGGLYNNPANHGAFTVRNTIIANNSGGNCGGTLSTIVSHGYNLDSGTTCNFLNVGDISNTDPLLGPLQNNGGETYSHEPASDRPVIDGGTNDDCPPLDQRGYSRPADGDGNGSKICDIGSVEVEDLITFFYVYLPLVIK